MKLYYFIQYKVVCVNSTNNLMNANYLNNSHNIDRRLYFLILTSDNLLEVNDKSEPQQIILNQS